MSRAARGGRRAHSHRGMAQAACFDSRQSLRQKVLRRTGRVTQVVFAATPHTGSRRATLLDRLRFFGWPSTIARTLVANDPALRSINVAYRGFADGRRRAGGAGRSSAALKSYSDNLARDQIISEISL